MKCAGVGVGTWGTLDAPGSVRRDRDYPTSLGLRSCRAPWPTPFLCEHARMLDRHQRCCGSRRRRSLPCRVADRRNHRCDRLPQESCARSGRPWPAPCGGRGSPPGCTRNTSRRQALGGDTEADNDSAPQPLISPPSSLTASDEETEISLEEPFDYNPELFLKAIVSAGTDMVYPAHDIVDTNRTHQSRGERSPTTGTERC